MKYRNLGKSGLKISELSYGSWVTFSFQIDTSMAVEMMKIAYDNGVNYFDNAEAYANGKSEEIDYLDLFFCHRPDPETPIEETVRAMHSLIIQGKIIYWGTSEWSADQIEKAYRVSEEKQLTPPTMEQPEYNIFNREKMENDYLDLFKNRGLGTTIWSPLASGVLTGKYQSGIPDDTRMNLNGYEFLKDRLNSDKGRTMLRITNDLEEISNSIGVPLVNLALGWCLQNKNVSTVILGASNPDQLKQNLKTVNYLEKFDDSVMKKIDEIIS